VLAKKQKGNQPKIHVGFERDNDDVTAELEVSKHLKK
jgi:hypothetical protein